MPKPAGDSTSEGEEGRAREWTGCPCSAGWRYQVEFAARRDAAEADDGGRECQGYHDVTAEDPAPAADLREQPANDDPASWRRCRHR